MGLFKKNEKLSWHEYTKEVFLEYLKCRYPGKNFLPIALYPDVNFIEFRAYPEGGDREKDLIIAYMMRDLKTKEAKINDNYFFEYIRKEYEECIGNVIGQFFQKYKLYCVRNTSSVTYADEVKTEYTWKYMQQNNLKINIEMFVFFEDAISKEELTDKLNGLKRELEKEKVYGSMNVRQLKQGYLDKVHADNYTDYSMCSEPEINEQLVDKVHLVIRG